MSDLFNQENAELLVAVSRLSLQAVDRMTGAMPPDEHLPAGEVSAITCLISGALNQGLGIKPRRRR